MLTVCRTTCEKLVLVLFVIMHVLLTFVFNRNFVFIKTIEKYIISDGNEISKKGQQYNWKIEKQKL